MDRTQWEHFMKLFAGHVFFQMTVEIRVSMQQKFIYWLTNDLRHQFYSFFPFSVLENFSSNFIMYSKVIKGNAFVS